MRKQMKQIIATMALSAVMLCGCGSSGVSQEEYDKVVAERDELQNEYNNLEKVIEVKTKTAEYTAKIDAEYEHALFILTVLEKASGANAQEAKGSLEETHSNAEKTIEAVASLFETADSLAGMSTETLESTMDSLDKIYNAWEIAYGKVAELEEIITNSEGVSESNTESQRKESVIYQDKTVVITYKGLTESKYGNGYEINFEVENLTEKTLTIQLRETSINGIMVNPMCSIDIAPGKKAINNAEIWGDDAESIPMSEVKNIETKFHIFNDSDWSDRYDTDNIVVLNIK